MISSLRKSLNYQWNSFYLKNTFISRNFQTVCSYVREILPSYTKISENKHRSLSLLDEKECTKCCCKADDVAPCTLVNQCLNVATQIECDPDHCPAKDKCQNRNLRNGEQSTFDVKFTGNKACSQQQKYQEELFWLNIAEKSSKKLNSKNGIGKLLRKKLVSISSDWRMFLSTPEIIETISTFLSRFTNFCLFEILPWKFLKLVKKNYSK